VTKQWTSKEDRLLLKLKDDGGSLGSVAKRLGRSLGSVTGRYYRLRSVVWPSQKARDEALKRKRRSAKRAKANEQFQVALEAMAAIERGEKLKTAVDQAIARGASLEMIGVCLGISKQAVQKRYRAGCKKMKFDRWLCEV
jgi:hypothetical protein